MTRLTTLVIVCVRRVLLSGVEVGCSGVVVVVLVIIYIYIFT